MTEARANEIFKTVYPNGEIIRKYASSAGYKYWVNFGTNKSYYYYTATSYAELLRRLKFKVAYKHDVEHAQEALERYTNNLNKLLNGVKPPLFNCFKLMSDEEAMVHEIENAKAQVEKWTKILREYNEEYIID